MLSNEELPVASTYIDGSWTLVTTQRVLSFSNNFMQQIATNEIVEFDTKHSKGKTNIIQSKIGGTKGKKIECFIETGRASMVIIYAIQTLINLERQAS
jgi:hypothetical protein